MKKISNVKKVKIKANPVHYATGVLFMALIAITLYFVLKPTNKMLLLEKGIIEKTTLNTAYVIKDESIIEKDFNKVLVPVIAEGAKTQKGGIIATYKGAEYENYEDTLLKMDHQILELMNDLPIVYSSEVDAIDNSIYALVKESISETSYAKMQEYRQKINTYINKRANIIGELSPAGAEIKELIKQRNEYETSAKKSNDNIIAPITGIVTYKTDGLETKLNLRNIESLDYSIIKEMIEKSDLINNTNIKVVNNYEAYIITKVQLEIDEYLKVGASYKLRLIENNNDEIKCELIKKNEQQDGIELVLKITNGIEKLVNAREIEVEIILWQTSGLIINNEALKKYTNKDIFYLNAIRYSEIVQIPVKILKQNDKYSVIDNYTNEELNELDLTSKYKIKVYDRIIVSNEK